jgi:hypothetical protein
MPRAAGTTRRKRMPEQFRPFDANGHDASVWTSEMYRPARDALTPCTTVVNVKERN